MPIKKIRANLVLVSFFLIASTLYAAMPSYLALNHETKQCAGYWPGDENVTFVLPDGWTTFPLKSTDTGIKVETDIGICKVRRDAMVGFAFEEACCSQLVGYTFVSKNIGIRTYSPANLTFQAAIATATSPEQNQNEQNRFFYVFAIAFAILLVTLLIIFLRQSEK